MEKLEKMAEEVRIGGKGSMRRKVKRVHKSVGVDDKRLQSTMQKLPGFQPIPGVEEVNMFKDDGTVIHFVNPKVQLSQEAKTWTVTGNSETKKVQDMLPGILGQLGIDSLPQLKKNVGEAEAAAEKKECENLHGEEK